MGKGVEVLVGCLCGDMGVFECGNILKYENRVSWSDTFCASGYFLVTFGSLFEGQNFQFLTRQTTGAF